MKELLELELKKYEYGQIENSRSLSCTGCGLWDTSFEYKELVGWIPPAQRDGKTLGVFECKCGTKFSYHIGITDREIIVNVRIAIDMREWAMEKKNST